jgi:hypothetical protein
MRDFLHHFFLPRHSNNHRPKLLHHGSLVLLIISLFVISLTGRAIHKEYPSVLGISSNIPVQELLTLTNQKRHEKGLAPLKLNTRLSQAAAGKAQNMFAHNYWAHVAPDGTTPWVFIKGSGYEYLYAGENLARGFTTAPDVVNAWMASPTHRENMLSPNYNDIGFAVSTGSLTGSDTVLVVEMFGSKYISTSQPQEPPAVPLVNVLPSPTIVLPSTVSEPQPTSGVAVAAVNNNPLVDSKSTTRNMVLFLLILFIGVFVVDAIII